MPFDGPDGYVAGCEALARLWQPARPLSIPDWAAKYRMLSSKSSSEHGRWRNERVPYQRAIMEALDARHPAPIVVIAKSSQVGGTDIALNWIGRTVHQAPASFLVLYPTDRVGKKWVRLKLDPMIATCRELRSILPLGRKQNSQNSLLEKHYPGGAIIIGSAGIPDDVATVSVPYLLLDDVDRMPLVLDEEGDPVELALRRSTTFPRSKALMISTPTTEENSRIWPVWLSSTMDRYFVPCGHCGHAQHLRWEQLKWLPGKPKSAVYICEECAAAIEEHRKTEMLAAGAWQATHPERESEVKGFHINGLYTPIGLGDSWDKHAAAWERTQGKQSRIQVFFNTRLGEVHKGERQKIEWAEVKKRAEPYRLRTVPPGVVVLTSGTDVQADRLETQILGTSRGERMAVIDYVVHRGDPLHPQVWSELDAYLATEIVNSFDVPMRLSCSMIDSGYLTDTVLGFTRTRKARAIFASRGSSVATRLPIGRPSYPDTKRRGRADHRGVERYEIGVSMLKHWMFECLRSDAGTPDRPVLPTERHFTFSTELLDEYYKQLLAEIYDPKHGWIERANYHRNEALDTLLLARAAAMHHSVAVHRMRDPEWDRLEQLYQPTGKKAAAPAELGKQPIATPWGFLPTAAKVR